jgi:hypothetical protein
MRYFTFLQRSGSPKGRLFYRAFVALVALFLALNSYGQASLPLSAISLLHKVQSTE